MWGNTERNTGDLLGNRKITVKVLVWDIETAPNLAHVWGLWDQNVGLPQLLEPAHVLCFAAKWLGEDKIMFHKGPGMVTAAHKLLNQADAVISYNGMSFDTKWMQTEFALAGLTAPAPWTEIDLCRIVKQRFKFPSNKLDYVAGQLLGHHKQSTGGHTTWIGCMNDNKAAWATMRKYNEADVVLTEQLFERLKPWIKLPNPALYGAADVADITCPQCGTHNVKKDGLAYTALSVYQRYQCRICGRYSRGKRLIASVGAR